MISRLAVPYEDTRATALGWSLGLEPQPAHAVLDVVRGDQRLHLRVLGASHQVIAEGPVTVSETVACLPDPMTALPPAVDADVPGGHYRLRTRVRRYSPADFAAAVKALVRRFGPDPQALVGRFPGDRLAVTALWAMACPDLGRAQWSTWHAYPGECEIVRTMTYAHGGDAAAGSTARGIDGERSARCGG